MIIKIEAIVMSVLLFKLSKLKKKVRMFIQIEGVKMKKIFDIELQYLTIFLKAWWEKKKKIS